MITAEANNLLTRVGRGTPMGDFMRQFWIPACMSSELQPGADPMRLMLLGEKLIAFRDPSGRVGIMDHQCPHRCASLFFGRNEEGGIRCAYHGWKFDVDGKCLEQPNLPEKNRYTDHLKAKAFRTRERGGLVYVYMGDRKIAPELPEIEPTMCDPDDAAIALTQRDCNWLQNLEGDVDTSHVGFLHMGGIKPEDLDPTDPQRFTILHKAPEFNTTATEFGAMYSASRPGEPGTDFHRFGCFIYPFWVTYPSADMRINCSANAWVPIDDTHTMVFNIGVKSYSGQGGRPLRYKDGTVVPGLARPVSYLPNTTDWMGRWRAVNNEANDYGIDRAWQRRDSFSGIAGIPMQDHAIISSCGDIADRTIEHLASSDAMIVATRRVLTTAVKEYQESGKLPSIIDNPAVCRDVRGGDITVPTGTHWLKGYEDALKTAVGPNHRPQPIERAS